LGLGNGTSTTFTTYADAARFMRAQPAGARFGVVYQTGAGGHAVSAKNTLFGLFFRDFQSFGIPSFSPPGMSPTSVFDVFLF
jgi:hypothetical protein